MAISPRNQALGAMFIFLAGLLVGRAAGESLSPATQSANVKVNVAVKNDSIVCKSFIGFGAEWNPYYAAEVSDAQWSLVAKRMAWMRIPAVRMLMMTRWCYLGEGRYDWETPEMKILYRHLDICQKLGVSVFLADWGCERGWVSAPGIAGIDDPKYAAAIGTYLDYLVNQRGYTCLKYFILVNEPNNEARSWEVWKQGVRNVAGVLAQRGLNKKVLQVGSDATFDVTWHQRAVDQLPDVLGVYDMHIYALDKVVRAGELETLFQGMRDYANTRDPKGKDKPFIVGEAGMHDDAKHPHGNPHINEHWYGMFMADYAVQAARAGCASVLAWQMDDTSHAGFFWGLWSASADGMKLRPWFFPWSLLSRYIPAGSTIYRPDAVSPAVRVLAARAPGKDGQAAGWTFCVVNRGDAPATVTLTAPAEISSQPATAPSKSVTFKRYLYSPEPLAIDADGFPKPTGEITADPARGLDTIVPANAVVVLTSLPW